MFKIKSWNKSQTNFATSILSVCQHAANICFPQIYMSSIFCHFDNEFSYFKEYKIYEMTIIHILLKAGEISLNQPLRRDWAPSSVAATLNLRKCNVNMVIKGFNFIMSSKNVK